VAVGRGLIGRCDLVARTVGSVQDGGMLSLLLLLGVARAGSPSVALPAGEDPAAWTIPIRLAGLTLASAGEDADIRFVQGEGGWNLVVAGQTRVHVASPGSASAREDVAQLAASLGTRLGLGPGPAPISTVRAPEPAREAAPVRVVPAPVPRETVPVEARPAVEPTPLVAAPVPEPPPPVAPPGAEPVLEAPVAVDPPPVVTPPSVSPRGRPRVDLAVAASLRAETSASWTPSVGLGWGGDHGSAGLVAAWQPARELQILGGGRVLRGGDLRAEGAWTPTDRGIRPVLGAGVGASRRIYAEPGFSEAEWMGTWLVGLGCGAHVQRWDLRPSVRIIRDLGPTTLSVGDGAAVPLDPWQVEVGLAFGAGA